MCLPLAVPPPQGFDPKDKRDTLSVEDLVKALGEVRCALLRHLQLCRCPCSLMHCTLDWPSSEKLAERGQPCCTQ